MFKGGTCLKKCYLETYRFSEDLDFSLLPDAAYTREGLAQILREIAERTTDLSGIDFPIEVVAVRERVDRQGRVTFEGKVGYRGPLSVPTTSSAARYHAVRASTRQSHAALDLPSLPG